MHRRLKVWMTGWVALVALWVGCGQEPGPPPPPPAPPRPPIDATFRIANVPDTMVKFLGVMGSKNYLLDSLPLRGGTVTLKRDTALPTGLYYLVLPGGIQFQFLLDADQQFTFTADAAHPLSSVGLDGSFDNELLYQYLNWEETYFARILPLEQQFAQAKPKSKAWEESQMFIQSLLQERRMHVATYREKHPEMFFTQYNQASQYPEMPDIRLPDGRFDDVARLYYFRNHIWDNTRLDDPRWLRTPLLADKLNTYLVKATPQVHDSVTKYAARIIEQARVSPLVHKFVVNWIAEAYHEPQEMGMETVFVWLVDTYINARDAAWATPEERAHLQKLAGEMRPSLVGKPGQNLTCTNLAGEPEALDNLKGPATIVFIYSYECERCQAQAPLLRKEVARYRSRGVEVYALCTGPDAAEWRKFVEQHGLHTFHNVTDPLFKSNYAGKYHIDHTPEIYVLDAAHKIVAKDLEAGQVPVILDRLL